MIPKNIRTVFWILFIAISFLQTAAIRRNEDGIKKAQTDPISLKKKMEETKDGVKGAPAPVFEYYKKEQFLNKDAVQVGNEKQTEQTPVSEVSEVAWEEDTDLEAGEEPLLEQAAEDSPASEEDEWWIEE